LGKRHRYRGCRYARVQDLAGNACMTGLTQASLASGLTNRWSARVRNKVPGSKVCARGAQLNR
jgi:hypothetical protein